MDTHYNWSDPEFMDECGESLNLAVNAVAEVPARTLHRSAYRGRGDLNGDGPITAADAAIALWMAVSGDHNDNADMDCDGWFSSVDALMILQVAAGSIEIS